MAADPYKYFRIESREILADLGSGLLELEKGAAPEVVARLLRLAHTLKGAARVVRQVKIGDLAHQLEDLFVELRDGKVAATREGINRALALVDAMATELSLLPTGAPETPEPTSSTVSAVAVGTPVTSPATVHVRSSMPSPAALTARTLTPAASPPPPGLSSAQPVPAPERLVRTDAAEIDSLSDGVLEVSAKVVSLRRSTTALNRAVTLSAALADTTTARVGLPVQGQTIALVDELSRLLRGLDRDVSTLTEQLERELGQVRDAVDRLRLLPVQVIFPRLERTVRDAAVSLDRDVVFEARGGEMRLDAEVLSALEHCLVQLVRNAVAHGIEPASERERAGKDGKGKVEVVITRRGNHVVTLCADDGRGIDVEAVRRALVGRGMAVDDARALDDAALLSTLLKGGISTSSTVTPISGRGVGLDVVRETAQKLGGELTSSNETGRGTRFELRFPASVSALDALLVEVGDCEFALPLPNVRQTLAIQDSAISRSTETETLSFEGQLLPFASLAKLLGAHTETRGQGRSSSVVVVEGAGRSAALGITRVVGTAHVVARALPRYTPALRLVAAASLNEEGDPRLVLDPDRLVLEASRATALAVPERPRRAPILVVDDSLTTRMLEQSILESAGYEVELATSAEEAMQKAEERPYSLFLVDVEMPGMDGFTFVERSRAMPRLRDIPAILVTSRNSADDKRRGEAAGASGYVVKGEFDQNALLERIRRLVK